MIINKFYLVFIVLVLDQTSAHLLEGLYCGKDNCYEILGVTRSSTKSEISKSYRQLARKFHPDLQKGEDKKAEATEKFKAIATAYEILKDEEARSDYDYMLDNPSEYYAHYYRYYRRRVAPKVDIRIVLAVTITIISVIQYYGAWQRYETAISYFMTVPKYRHKALELAKVNNDAAGKKKTKNKQEQKEELEKLIRMVIEDNMDIKGAYAKPDLWNILWVQLIISPYTITKYIIWYTSWIWKFDILKRPYGTEEKLYLIRKNLKLGEHQFNAIEEHTKEEYLEEELWIKDKFIAWKKIQEEEMKKNLAENARAKAYRRYMKNHGVSRMTFDDS
ncbi:dnaJ homolog subfamily C member 25 homolog [Ctenocephalides felis]|uniref:dnaJ homolog subfamily C member 25 homolog n=1 Tax=Ctenocephalides felis TaxID=7515 RepID=UPI000E6E47D0|nr:dnaJ homolog subfamily C member 25 homolog [Ctenocephalides felis]